AHIEALIRRGLSAAKAVDEAGLEAHPQSVLVIQRFPFRESHQWPVKLHVSAQAGDLIGNEKALSAMWTDGAVNGAEAEGGRDGTGYDSLQRVGAGNIAEIQRLEQVARSVTERINRGVIQGIGESHALEGMSQEVTH